MPAMSVLGPRLIYAAVILALQVTFTSAFWFTRPPECGGRCYERDHGHPLAKCPVELLRNVVSDDQADALIALAEVREECEKGEGERGGPG